MSYEKSLGCLIPSKLTTCLSYSDILSPCIQAKLIHNLSGLALLLWCVCMPQTMQKKCGAVVVLKMYSAMDSFPLMILTSCKGTQIMAYPLLLLQIEQLQRKISSNPFNKKTSNWIDPQ